MVNICAYVDILKYYQDYLKFRKAKDPKFSYEIWASELGFKSRTFMKLIASGKRKTTNKLIEVFSEKNGFSQREKQHLTHLSMYQYAKTEMQKKIHFEAVLQTLDAHKDRLVIQNYEEFVSTPDLPVLQLALSFGLNLSEKKLAQVLNVSEKQIKAKLKKLETLGMIDQEKGYWKARNQGFKVPDRIQSRALKKYHAQSLQESLSVIEKDKLQRHFRSIIFALNDEKFADLAEEVETFLNKLKNKYSSVKTNSDRIFKLNLQTYPATQPLVEDK